MNNQNPRWSCGHKKNEWFCNGCKRTMEYEGSYRDVIDKFEKCPMCGTEMYRGPYNVMFQDIFGEWLCMCKDLPPNYKPQWVQD